MSSLQTIVKGKPNEELITTILVNKHGQPSAYLRNLSRNFATCFHGETRIISIYEKYESKTLTEVCGRTWPNWYSNVEQLRTDPFLLDA